MFQQLLIPIYCFIATVGVALSAQICHSSTELCNCTEKGKSLTVSCKDLNSFGHLQSTLDGIAAQYVDNLTISNSRIKSLEDLVSQRHIFGFIRFQNVTGMELIAEGALSASAQTLTQLSIEGNNNSQQISLPGLKELDYLTVLEITGGFSSITQIPSLPALRLLHLYGNRLLEPPDLPHFPRLQTINLCCGSLVTLTGFNLSNFPVLKKLYLFSNKLTSLDKGVLHVISPYLELLDVSDNGIHYISPSAFNVPGPNIHLRLQRNLINTVDFSVFEPLVNFLIRGRGQIHLQGNPVRCDCSIAWLVRRPDALRKVMAEFTCIDSRSSLILNPKMYLTCL